MIIYYSSPKKLNNTSFQGNKLLRQNNNAYNTSLLNSDDLNLSDVIATETYINLTKNKKQNKLAISKCISVKVFSPDNLTKSTEALLLFDDRSTDTYVTDNLANKMSLKINKLDSLQISTFNNQSKSIKSKRIRLAIQLRNK